MRSYPVLHFWRCLSCLVSWCLVKNQKYGYLSLCDLGPLFVTSINILCFVYLNFSLCLLTGFKLTKVQSQIH